MIRIEIDNASATPAYELRAVAACLIAIAAGDNGATHTETTTVGNITRTVTETPIRPIAPRLAEVKKSVAETIAAADRPDAGAPTIEPVAQGEPLRELAIDPKVAFGAVPNVPAVPASNTVAVAALPTVPAVPPVTLTTPAPAPLPTAVPAPGVAAQTDEGAPSDAQFDKTGLPWDGRIHSRGRSMNSDGTWRAKRGVDDATVAAVVAELRGVVAAPAVTAADVDAAEANWPFKPPAAAVPAVPAAPAAVPAPPAPPAAVAVSFPDFMARVVPAVAAEQISELQLTTILGEYGVPSLPLLAARPDLIPTISSRVDALIAGGQ